MCLRFGSQNQVLVTTKMKGLILWSYKYSREHFFRKREEGCGQSLQKKVNEEAQRGKSRVLGFEIQKN